MTDASCQSGCMPGSTVYSFNVFQNTGNVSLILKRPLTNQSSSYIYYFVLENKHDLVSVRSFINLFYRLVNFFFFYFSLFEINFPLLFYFVYIKVTETTLTMKQVLFSEFNYTSNWMVTYSATVPGNIEGSSSIVFQLNQIPYGGSCTVNQTTGYALSTDFEVSCEDWSDDDGQIVRYELNGIQVY
jgi:hypothetical protein